MYSLVFVGTQHWPLPAMTLTRIPLHYVIVTAIRPKVSELFTCLCICLHVIRISSGLSWGPTLAFTCNDPSVLFILLRVFFQTHPPSPFLPAFGWPDQTAIRITAELGKLVYQKLFAWTRVKNFESNIVQSTLGACGMNPITHG